MASDINSVVLVGRLVRDAEMRYSSNGNAIASFSVALSCSKKDGDQWVEESHFFDVSYFGRGAEAVKPYLTKGKQIAIQGSLRQDRWEKDGQRFSKVKIVANSVELLGSRSSSQGGAGGSSYAPRPRTQVVAEDAKPGQQYGGEDDFPEDIPF